MDLKIFSNDKFVLPTNLIEDNKVQKYIMLFLDKFPSTITSFDGTIIINNIHYDIRTDMGFTPKLLEFIASADKVKITVDLTGTTFSFEVSI